MGTQDAKINPARLTPAQLAAMLSRSGEQEFTEDDIEADIKAGAPTNEDGTLGLVAYGSWLVRETK